MVYPRMMPTGNFEPAVSQSRPAQRWAVCADPRGPEADAIRALLMAEGVAGEHWYVPKDVEDLDAAVRAGTYDVVLFPDRLSLFDALFDWKIHLDNWGTRRVCVRFLSAGQTSDTAGHQPYASDLLTVYAAYGVWRADQRKKRTIAGLILSLLALACAFAIIMISAHVAAH